MLHLSLTCKGSLLLNLHKQEQVEVSLIRLPITVQQVTFPLCLVAASCLRPQVRPRLGGIPAWPLRMIPDALVQCTVDLPSGLTVRPFADDPHFTQEGLSYTALAEIRAKVHRFLLQREISSNVAFSVREHLEWHPKNGLIQIFLQAFCAAGTSGIVRIYSTEERRLHTTCLETAKKAMESFGLFE